MAAMIDAIDIKRKMFFEWGTLSSFALDSPLKIAYTLPALQGAMGKIFEKLAISNQQSAFSQIGDRLNEKKGLRPLGHRSVEWHFTFCFQHTHYGGWGSG